MSAGARALIDRAKVHGMDVLVAAVGTDVGALALDVVRHALRLKRSRRLIARCLRRIALHRRMGTSRDCSLHEPAVASDLLAATSASCAPPA